MVNGVLTTFINVNNTADTHNPPAGDLTLRAAIDYASMIQGPKVIQLMVPGTYKITLAGTDQGNNATGAFDIVPNFGNVTILNASGGVATVDGNHLDRVFDINPGDDPNAADKFIVTLQGITITNGIAQSGDGAAGSGGGIRDQGIASLTLNNVVVTNNIATADGGGISMENLVSAPWTLTINNSVISYNHAGDAGGGVETDGSSKVFINAGTVITGNTTVNQGGGVWLDNINPGSVASVPVTNSGTGTYFFVPSVTFTSVDGNGSGAQGTVVLNSNRAVIGVTITNPGSGYDMPPTVSFSLFGTPFPDITAVATLALCRNASTLIVTGAIISNNDALTGPGGGIGNAGNGAVTITGSTIEKNFSGNTGGGFADQNNFGSLLITSSLFLNNVALGAGGGIQEGGPSTTIINTESAGNLSGGAGGGLFANGASLIVTNCTFASNTASGDGNGLGGGGIELQVTGSSSITNTTITGNRALNNAGANGGGIDAALASLGSLALLNDTISANFATNGGGIFWGVMSTLSVQNTIIAQDFIATAGAGGDIDTNGIPVSDMGGNLIGVAGDGNRGFTAGTTQTGSLTNPLNPLLEALGNYGGPMIGAPGTMIILPTEALLPGSPALNKGVKAGAPVADERNVKNGAAITIGAVNV